MISFDVDLCVFNATVWIATAVYIFICTADCCENVELTDLILEMTISPVN